METEKLYSWAVRERGEIVDRVLESVICSSEAEIRKKMLPQLLSETHDEKMSRLSGLVNEFVNTLGLDNVYVSTSGGEDGACVNKLCKQQYL